MAQWIGYMVSINCGEKGTYQGQIIAATGSIVTLTKTFCDGIPCAELETVLRAEDIVDLKLIDKENSSTAESTVSISKPIAKRAGRTLSSSENKSLNHNGSYNHGFNKSKPIDIEVKQNNVETTPSIKNSTPVKKEKTKGKWNKGWKDEACFGSPLEHILAKEFDFEKNLALFDKQAIFDEINNSQRPDIVKQTDSSRKLQTSKYRHDENILETMPTTYRQITIPKHEFCEYVTDDGLIIPSISTSLRNKLWCAADKVGLSSERRIELMGRAAAEMALQLLGGDHRLNPHNSHQCPTVAVLCGPNIQGAMGINTARHLASHGVNTIVVTPSDAECIKQELTMYRLTRNQLVTTISGLPRVTDLTIVALSELSENPVLYRALATWSNNNKAPVLAIDPPAVGTPGISTKFSLVPVLPLPHSIENGKIYLCNLGFPLQIFSDVGIKYKSPFGSKFVIPLHRNDDI